MIHRIAFGVALLLIGFSLASIRTAVDLMSKDLFLLAAQYFSWAVVFFGIGGAVAWLKFELAMTDRRRWA